MATIRVQLTDEQMADLARLAERLGVSVEQLAALGLRQSLLDQGSEFLQGARHVLRKNEELYRRLA